MLYHLSFPQRGKVARRAGWGDFLYGRVGGLPVYRLHRVTDTMKCVRLPDALGQDWSSGCLPPGKSARANASDGTFSGRRPELLSVFGSRAPPWSLRVGRESRGPREGESKHPPWPSGPAERPRKKEKRPLSQTLSAGLSAGFCQLYNFCEKENFGLAQTSRFRSRVIRACTASAGLMPLLTMAFTVCTMGISTW